LKKFNFPLRQKDDRATIDRFMKKHNFTLAQNHEELLYSDKKELREQYPVAPTRSPLNVNSRCQSFEFDMRSNLKKPNVITTDYYENEEHNLNRFAYNI